MVAKKSVVFKNAIIDTAEGTITEITKDGENVFNLKEALAKWDGIEGVTINISTSDELLGDPAGCQWVATINGQEKRVMTSL